MNDMDAMFDEVVEEAGDRLTDKLLKFCEEAAELQEVLAGYEAAAKSTKARLTDLLNKSIPDAMAEAGMGDEFSLETGHRIKLSHRVRGSLPKDHDERNKAFAVLEAIGGEALIKTNVSMAFGKGEGHAAETAFDALVGMGFEPKAEKGVHAQSLCAFAREKVLAGEEVPLDDLGLFSATEAKITPPKG